MLGVSVCSGGFVCVLKASAVYNIARGWSYSRRIRIHLERFWFVRWETAQTKSVFRAGGGRRAKIAMPTRNNITRCTAVPGRFLWMEAVALSAPKRTVSYA